MREILEAKRWFNPFLCLVRFSLRSVSIASELEKKSSVLNRTHTHTQHTTHNTCRVSQTKLPRTEQS